MKNNLCIDIISIICIQATKPVFHFLFQVVLEVVKQTVHAQCSIDENGTFCYEAFFNSFAPKSLVRHKTVSLL